MTNKPNTTERELRDKISESIDGWRFEQEWVTSQVEDFPEHKGAGCGCGVCQKMAGLNTKATDQIMQLILADRQKLIARIESEVITAQDKKEYWPVWRKDLFDRQRAALKKVSEEA